LEDGFEEEEKRRVSVNLTESHLQLLEDTLKGVDRSKTIRRILDFYEKTSQERTEQIL
jgi:metal-responsive CopG/Arc/MetJ family transcriptional regulator